MPAFLYNRWSHREWLYQIIALLFSIVVVHVAYEFAIRPVAAMELAQQALAAESDDPEPAEAGTEAGGDVLTVPKLAVIVKDYEQEACFMMMFWAFFIMLFKVGEIKNARRLFSIPGRRGQENFLETRAGGIILPQTEDMQKYREIFERVEPFGENVLYNATSLCLNRFFTTMKVADATDAMRQSCDLDAERLETGLSIVRYLVWVIPSLGFIGTVRGISAALGQAEEAVRGNIAPVTENLGVAFNSTLVALLISVIVMFCLHKLKESQETLMLDVQAFCEKNLLRYLREKSG